MEYLCWGDVQGLLTLEEVVKKGTHYMFQLYPKFKRLTSFITERFTNQHTEDDILKMAKCRGRVVPSQLTKKSINILLPTGNITLF